MDYVEVKLTSETGKSITLGDGTPYRIYNEIEGLGRLSADLDTLSTTSGVGSLLNGVRLPTRKVVIHAVYTGKDKEAKRDNLTDSLAVGIEKYTLRIYYMGKTRELKNCRITDLKVSDGNIHDFVKADITVTALDPLFWGTQYVSFSSGSVNNGTAPALPILHLSGGGQGNYVSLGKYKIFMTNGGSATVDLENMSFSGLHYLSFSTDVRRICLMPGDALYSFGVSVSGQYKERYYSL